tara:strand:- start:117 stop:893 length:777 start_codon:yes stop_codon:yes gene_type:complete
MTGIVKTDQLQGAQSTTITIPTGNKISIADSATVGTLNATTMKGVTTFTDSSVFSGVTSFSGTVSGDNNHMVKVFHNTWSTDVSQVLANNIITTDYLHYKIFMRVQPDANSVVTVYLTSGGDSPTNAVNMAVYQGEYGLRAASSSMISTSLNGSNAYATFPTNHNIYANANCYAEFEIFNARSGGVSGVTNVQAARTRGFRFFSTQQSVNASDNHFQHGGGQFWNSTSSDNPTLTGFKFAPHTGNWAEGEISIYGFKV